MSHSDNSNTPAHPGTIIRLPEVLRTTGLSRPSVYRMVLAGTFPQRLHLSARAVGWLHAEVEQWIAERARTRPNAMPGQGLESVRAAA